MSIHHQAEIPASAAEVYELLADASALSALSRMSGAGGRAAGEEFSAFDGHVTGRQVELVPGAMLVQAWRFPVWEAGLYTIVRFTLEATATGTRLSIDQRGEPDGPDALGCHSSWRDHLDEGWLMFYLTPLARHCAQAAAAKVTAACEIAALTEAARPLTGSGRHG